MRANTKRKLNEINGRAAFSARQWRRCKRSAHVLPLARVSSKLFKNLLFSAETGGRVVRFPHIWSFLPCPSTFGAGEFFKLAQSKNDQNFFNEQNRRFRTKYKRQTIKLISRAPPIRAERLPNIALLFLWKLSSVIFLLEPNFLIIKKLLCSFTRCYPVWKKPNQKSITKTQNKADQN